MQERIKMMNSIHNYLILKMNCEGSEYEIPMDIVVLATGSQTDQLSLRNLELTEKGYIKIDKNRRATLINSPNNTIFAIGDVAGDKATVASAARTGRDVAEIIVKYL